MQSVTPNTDGILSLHQLQIHATAAEQGEKLARSEAAARRLMVLQTEAACVQFFTMGNKFCLQFSGFDFTGVDGNVFASLQQKRVNLSTVHTLVADIAGMVLCILLWQKKSHVPPASLDMLPAPDKLELKSTAL